jgi:hypothetical protein
MHLKVPCALNANNDLSKQQIFYLPSTTKQPNADRANVKTGPAYQNEF